MSPSGSGQRPLPELALRYILSEPAITTVIIGMRAAAHVHENLAVSDKGALSDSLVEALHAHRWYRP